MKRLNRLRRTEVERFWSFVRPEPGDKCWLWSGCTLHFGHGQFRLSHNGKAVAAHRYSYQLAFGPIPERMQVCHRCDVPACVNPAHLFLGTQADNMRDCKEKGRVSRGERRPTSKLTDALVREIRERAQSGETQASIARSSGVAQSIVSRVVTRRIWKHVE